jgi:MFS family permease
MLEGTLSFLKSCTNLEWTTEFISYCRFIAGIGVGGASTVVPLYISENAPRAIRGGLTGIYQLFVSP